MPDDPDFLLHVSVTEALWALEDVKRRADENPNLLIQEQALLKEVSTLAVDLFVKTLTAETITVEAA